MTPARKHRTSLINSISRYIFKKGISLTRRLSDKDGLARKLSELCYAEKRLTSFHCSFDNLPNEILLMMLHHFSLESVNNFALTSKKNMEFVKVYYLSSLFRSRMDSTSTSLNIRVFQQFLTFEERIVFAVEFFKRHYFSTNTDFPWTSFLYNVQSMIPDDSAADFQFRLLNVLRSSTEKMVDQRYYLNVFNDEGMATSEALRIVLSSLVLRDNLCFFLSTVLKWFNMNKKRAVLILLIYVPDYFEEFCHVDYSTLTDARKYLSPLAQALQSLCHGSIKGYEYSISADRLFGLIENITTFPSPWVMRNYISLLLLSPDTCYIACYFRALRDEKEDYNELRDIVFEAVCNFSDWDPCYMDTFFSVVRLFNR